MVRGSGGVDVATCWLAGAVRALQKEVRELKEPHVERTEIERQSYRGKMQDELAERHITQEQLQNAHSGDLERDRQEAVEMHDNASSEYHVVSQVGSATDVEHGFWVVKEVRDVLSTVHALPPGIAMYSATTAVTAVDTTDAKTEARLLEIAKCIDKAVYSTVAESGGEARSLEIAKCSATAKSYAEPPGTAAPTGSGAAPTPVSESRTCRSCELPGSCCRRGEPRSTGHPAVSGRETLSSKPRSVITWPCNWARVTSVRTGGMRE